MKKPCYDPVTKRACTRRKVGCAITCKEWQEYVELRDEMYRERMQAREAIDYKRKSREKVREKFK